MGAADGEAARTSVEDYGRWCQLYARCVEAREELV